MAFLFSPKARPFTDESLESYLLRVVAENFFDSYQQLSLAIREELHELDFEAYGAFPVELKRLNVYHAKQNSHFRMRALHLLESLLGLPAYELQKLAVLKSDRHFVGATTAVYRNSVDIPLSFIRHEAEDGTSSIPICPKCLAEAPYIRQIWHLKPYQVCVKHECDLVHQCPECHQPINYIESESIIHCSCGFDFTTAPSLKVDNQDLVLSRCLMHAEPSSDNPLLSVSSVSQRLAALLWYKNRHSKADEFAYSDAVKYFYAWPDNLYEELDYLTEGAELKLIDLFNRTPFRFIYGELILTSRCLYPDQKEPHFIHIALIHYLMRLVEQHPKSKKANVGDMLLSIAETAIVLSTTHEQVYRLYQNGVLTSAFKQKMKQRINPHSGVFFLRQVVEYKRSFGSERMYVSAW